MPIAIDHEVYRFRLQCLEPMRLPPYKGSALRGVFGHAFKAVVCALRRERCPSCLVRASCTYQRVFESRVAPGEGPRQGVDAAPHPYVLGVPLDGRTEYGEGDEVAVTLTLLGPALGILPYLVYAFQEVGRRGLTPARKPLALAAVEALGEGGWQTVYAQESGSLLEARVAAAPPAIPHLSRGAAVILETPLRLQERGELVRDPGFGALFLAARRRLGLLARYYGGGEPPFDRGLLDASRAVPTTRSELRWHDWTRYSNRQQTKMQLGGVVGTLVFEADLTPFAPWLAWAERLHLGKATSFGLGKLRLIPLGAGGTL
ncbi:MAG: CRISPR system precrRNA processing endoribonuclease RAMP protein Cas6 [Thermodesulfobacteriota bacterium]